MIPFSISEKNSIPLFYAFSTLTVLSVFIGSYLDVVYLFLIPWVVIFCYFALFDFKKVYFLLVAAIPLTREFNLSGSLSLDIPGEPLLILLMFIGVFYLMKSRKFDIEFIKNPYHSGFIYSSPLDICQHLLFL